MSATEILDELPKLIPAELEIIYRRAVQLHRGQALDPSPEFLAAIDAADESFAKEGGVSVREARGLEDVEDLMELRSAVKENAGKPGVPWEKVKTELDLD